MQPLTGRRQTSCLCASAAEKLNKGLPRTNPTVVKAGLELRIHLQIEEEPFSSVIQTMLVNIRLKRPSKINEKHALPDDL